MSRQIDVDAVINAIRMKVQGANPATPAASYGLLFVKVDGVYYKDAGGAVTGPFIDTAGSAGSLDDLSDVVLTSPTLNQLLQFNGTIWVNATAHHDHLSNVTANQHHDEDHNHDGSPTQQLTQANTHGSPDTDAATSSLHHTIGTGATQAAAGNHAHGGSGNLTVEEEDGTPSVGSVSLIKVSNGTLTDNGSGSVSITTGGGGGGTSPNTAHLFADEMTAVNGNENLQAFISTLQKYNFEIENDHHTDGDAIEGKFFLAAGTYTMYVLGIANTNGGKLDWTIDGAAALSGQDWYSATHDYNTLKSGSVTIATDGNHTLRATVNGKNGSSSDYYFELTKIWFI